MKKIDWEFLKGRHTTLTVADMCRVLGCSKRSVYNWEKSGDVPPSFKMSSGRSRLWNARDVLAFYEKKFAQAARA